MKREASRLKRRQKGRINLWCWIFMVPALLLYLLFQGYPILAGAFYATLDWSGLSSYAVFVGIDNFKEFMHDPLFLTR